jgi:N4-gp56 family major capsid protein
MSSLKFTSASNHAIKIWARKAFNDAVKTTLYGKLTGSSDRSVVQVKTELKNEGDRVRFALRALPAGLGVQEDETLEGNEEGLEFKYFDLNLGEKRHAIKVDLNLSAQRTMFDVRAEAKEALQEWIEEYLDTTFFEYLTGSGKGATTAISKYHANGVLGGNSLLAPSSDRIVYGGTGVSAKAALTASDVMSLTTLDKIAERVKLASPTMRKANFGGKTGWVVILHPWQVTDLRKNTNAGQWFDIQKAAMTGGQITGNPIFSESLGMYRDFVLVESTRVPTFSDYGAGANVNAARALVLGAQAAVVAHGKGVDEKGVMKLAERTFDYGKRYGVAATLIWGMAKSRFDSQSDFATFAVDTAATALV